jgi:hypothetical protein
MRIARLERVRWDKRCGAIGGRRVLLLLEHHHHGDVEGARGVVANLNVGVEERHVAEPLAERDVLMDDTEHRVCACATTTTKCAPLLLLEAPCGSSPFSLL